MKNSQTQLIYNNLLISEDIKSRPVKSSITAASTVSDLFSDVPNLKEAATFNRLLDCLDYALALDDNINLAAVLNMDESLSNRQALIFWVKNETHGIRFLDASALFNFLIRQLDNLVIKAERAS